MSILNPVASAPLEAPMEVQTVSLPQRLRSILPVGIAGFTSIIFLDSLRYKFTNHPNTQVIFGKLNDWAASFGAEGLFAQTGLFSQYVIGTAELAASALLLFGILPALRRLQAIGSLIAVLVMTGAISFHLFTPLGIDPNNDGGGLFAAAVMVWTLSVTMLIIRRREIGATVQGLARAVVPQGDQPRA